MSNALLQLIVFEASYRCMPDDTRNCYNRIKSELDQKTNMKARRSYKWSADSVLWEELD